MAVKATPVEAPLVSDVECEDQNILVPETVKIDGFEINGKRRTVITRQGMKAVIDWTMLNRDGDPVNLISCGFPCPTEDSSSSSSSGDGEEASCPSICFRMRESLSVGRSGGLGSSLSIEAKLVDAGTGRVRVELTPAETAHPGVYLAEFAIVDTEGVPCFSNVLYVVIERGQFGIGTVGGPPSLAEIRLHLRDNAPEDNFLIERIDFDWSEIALAIERPIMFWNDVPPPLTQFMTTQNFKFRWAWLEGIVGNLFLMAEESYRRNDLQYQAAGVNIADKAKHQLYAQAGQRRWGEYKQWVRQTKASINLESGFGELVSPYSWFSGFSGGRTEFF